MPIAAQAAVAEVGLGKVPTAEMSGTCSRSDPANVSCCETVACVSKARGVPGEMMSAQTAMRKSVAATMKASPSGMESASSQVHAADMSHAAQAAASEVHATQMPEMHTAKTHASQAHTAEVHAAQVHTPEMHAAEASHLHPSEAPAAEMHPAATEVAATTKSSEPSRLCVGHEANG
jgi:hypothetical protein